MAKKPVPSPAADHALRDHQPREGQPAPIDSRGDGDELHQQVGDGVADAAAYLTDNFGHRISDNQNSLRAGARGPTLLEDFALREKIFHFDHERIPERSEEHTSELQSLMRISYAVFCLKKKKKKQP